MANVADTFAVPGSNLERGAGTNTATFTLPATPGMKVQSVVATVDNSAGGDTTATLVLADQSGEVIATQNQDDVIPAGQSGTASFALGLRRRTPVRPVLRGLAFTDLAFLGAAGGLGDFNDTRPMNSDLFQTDTILVPLCRTRALPVGGGFKCSAGNEDIDTRQVSLFYGEVTRHSTLEVEVITATAMNLAPGAFADLAFAHSSGPALLTYADPTEPRVGAADMFTVTLSVTWAG